MWRRKGWAAMGQMREKLEGLKGLRDPLFVCPRHHQDS